MSACNYLILVLDRLGCADSTLIAAYHHAYLKHLEEMNFVEEMLKDDFQLPEIKIQNPEKYQYME